MTKIGRFTAVISSHGDGEFLSHAIESYGHPTIRGSSRKDSTNAMRGIIAAIKSGISICLTPDGPRGPRFKIKGNLTNLAVKYKLPIIPVCYSASRAKVLSTWDRFIIPYPFSKIIIELGDPVNLKKPDDAFLEEVMNSQMKQLDEIMNLRVEY